jgi:hypothetical protein
MTDRIMVLCSKCREPFGERAPRLRNGYQVQCPNCMMLSTFDSSSEDPNIRRPLKAARDFWIAAEEAIVLARMAAQGPKRDPVLLLAAPWCLGSRSPFLVRIHPA